MLCEDLEDKEKEYGGICNQKIMIDIIMAHHLMEKIPHNQSGSNLMIEQASILIENLQEDKEVAQKTGDTGLAGDVNKLLTELKRFNEYGLKNWGKRVPFSDEKIKNALRLRLEAGFLMLEKAKEAGKDVNHNDKHNKAYQTMHDNLMRLKNKIRTASYPVFLPVNPTGKQIKQVVQPYFDKFRQDLEQALAPMATVSDYNVKTFRHIIDENFTESLNKTGWDPIINEFSVQAKGKEHHLRSQIFPASNIEKILSKDTEDTEDKKCSVKIFASPYQETEGRSCRSNKEDQHAINLAMTTLHIKQPNGKDNRIFCGNRHAVHDHMGITDPVKRKTANKKSAQEGLALAIVSNDTLLEQAKKAQQAISEGKAGKDLEPVKLSVTPLSLLTPDLVREFCSKDSNERQFMKNQLEVWQDLQNLSQAGKLTLPMDIKRSGQPQDIPIELDLCAFNFGVNQGAFLKGASNVIGGWAGVENMNKVALEKINNRVDAHLKQGDKIIEELPTLITEEFTKLIEEIYTLVDDKHIVKKDVGSEKIEEFISTWPKGIKEIKGIFKNPLSQEPDKLKAFESDLSGLQTILENIKKSSKDSKDSKDSKVKDKFELVLESVGKIKNTLESVQKLVLIRKLARQINQIWQEKSYQSMGNEPYKMPSRLALLTYWLDGVAMWNCRSGKDRTGMLDAEAKFLAFYVHTFGDIPEPDTLLSEELNYMKQQFLLNSGNLEMQALNTGGLEGYKTEGVPAIDPLRNRPIFPAYRTGLSSQARG